MKLIWIFLIIYIVIRVLGRVNKGRERIPGMPGDYPAGADEEVAAAREDPEDLPLSGPWNRRPVPSPAGDDMTLSKEKNEDDLPVQGPWSRRENPVPEPVWTEPEEVTDRKKEKATERVAAEPSVEYLPERMDEVVRPSEQREIHRDSLPEIPSETCRTGKYRRTAIVNGLLSPQGLYNGIIMSEVLRNRGGRSRRR